MLHGRVKNCESPQTLSLKGALGCTCFGARNLAFRDDGRRHHQRPAGSNGRIGGEERYAETERRGREREGYIYIRREI